MLAFDVVCRVTRVSLLSSWFGRYWIGRCRNQQDPVQCVGVVYPIVVSHWLMFIDLRISSIAIQYQ